MTTSQLSWPIHRLFVPRHARYMDAFTRLEVRYIVNTECLVCQWLVQAYHRYDRTQALPLATRE